MKRSIGTLVALSALASHASDIAFVGIDPAAPQPEPAPEPLAYHEDELTAFCTAADEARYAAAQAKRERRAERNLRHDRHR